VVAGVHTDFVVEIDGPTDFDMPTTTVDAVATMQNALEPLFAQHSIGSFAHCMETAGPLFRMILMKLPDDAMAYVVELSHIFADGATYYKVMDLINHAMNAKPLPTLQWRPAPESMPLPISYTDEDKQLIGGAWMPAFMQKFASYAPGTPNARVADIKLVNKEAAAALKEEYAEAAASQGIPFLSTNDLLTAGMCEIADPTAMCWMFANMRGRATEATDDLAGNYERGVHFPANEGSNPTFIRSKISKDFVYYGLDGNPHMSSDAPKEAVLAANFMIVTNWSSLQHTILPPRCELVGHCALSSFGTGLAGLDMAVVFQADREGTLAVMTNFIAGQRGRELDDRVANSHIFKRLFSPPETWEKA